VVVFVLAVLSVPLMMKWYHPLLVFCWNAALCPAFLPVRLPLWTMLAFAGLLFAVLSRAVSPNARFVIEPSVSKSLLALTGVVVATGLMTGGFGVHALGNSQYGGRKYFSLLAAVAGYFVLTSRQIPPQRAGLYVGLFFLSALTYGVSELANYGGRKFDFLWWFLSPQRSLYVVAQETPLSLPQAPVRMFGMWLSGAAVCSYLLARFGMRGLLDLSRPWRLVVFVAALGAVLHQFVIRPVLAAEPINQLLVTGGVLFFLQAVATLAFGVEFKNIGVRLPQLAVGEMYISVARLIAFLVALAGMIAMYLFLKRTYLGTAIRAISQDRAIMPLMGVNPNRIFLITSALGGALAGLAGCLLVLQYDIHPAIGLTFGPITFLICVLGGLGNMVGGFIAAFIFAQFISVGGYFLHIEWGYVIAFLFFIAMMFWRPQGILGGK